MCCNRNSRGERAYPRRENRIVQFYKAYQAYQQKRYSELQSQNQTAYEHQIQAVSRVEQAPPSYSSLSRVRPSMEEGDQRKGSAHVARAATTVDDKDFEEFETKAMGEAREFVERHRQKRL